MMRSLELTWQILQIKIYPQTILNTYSFIDDENQNKENDDSLKSHPKYKKYFKMVDCGVPKDAVKHKMILDNLDPNILDGKKESTIKETKKQLNNSLGNIFANKLPSKKIDIKQEIEKAKKNKQEKTTKNFK